MRSSTRRALTLGAITLTAVVAWSGCTAKKQTEYVAGISTQVQVPRDLRTVRVDVSVGGVIIFCRGYKVFDGKVQLPRSLGEFPQSGSPGPDPVTVTVSGFTEEFSDDKDVFNSNCSLAALVVNDPKAAVAPRILRRSRQPYVTDSVLFLPMPLKYSCFDVTGCDAEDKTCKAGQCVDAKIDETKLPKFTGELIDGTGGACFSPSLCFAASAPAEVVNAADCTYALPNSPPSSPPRPAGAPPSPFPNTGIGLNVEVTYDSGLTREILDKDDMEGFTIPDPAKPQQFRLAPGLCDLVKGHTIPTPANPTGIETAHRITAVRGSGVCRAKGQFEPFCAGDALAAMGADPSGASGTSMAPVGCHATELKPPKAALIVLADNTRNSDLFFVQASQATLGLSLADPSFSKTELGLSLFPGNGTCGTAGSFAPVVPLTPAVLAKDVIGTQFGIAAGTLKDLNVPVNLDGALTDAYAILGSATYAPYYRRAVLVIGNRGFDQATCGATPAVRAATAKTGSKVETYVLLLARNNQIADATVAVPGSTELAVAGGTLKAYDARQDKAPAQDAFQTIVNDLATCVYDVVDPSTRPKAGDTLSYSNPVDPFAKTETLAFNAACNTEGVAGNGFGVDATNTKRVYLCKATCDAYRNVLQAASLYGASTSQPALAVPVFAHKPGCAPAATGGNGSGNGG